MQTSPVNHLPRRPRWLLPGPLAPVCVFKFGTAIPAPLPKISNVMHEGFWPASNCSNIRAHIWIQNP